MAADVPAHSPYALSSPPGWILYVSHHETVRRLVVFVHGFNGKAVTTWNSFPESGVYRRWWMESDMLFIGYPSTKDTVTGVSHRLRNTLARFFPIPYPDAMVVDGISVRSDTESPYEELVLVGHSLGGLIIRRALCDAAIAWDMEGRSGPRPALLDAQIRLFSPASAGFQAAGVLGALRAMTIWQVVEVFLRRSPAYSELQPGSTSLLETRARTERLAGQSGFDALRAHIVWASPDEVVVSERYSTDHVDDAWDGTTHSSVCKPRFGKFENPWLFAETGRAR
ncbi:esterase/lipase family protein [Nocardia gipuzkoensis]|uniref:esterase/lipase family protein n=1 Tax=Nocardia gipuzkoensis TaxID=2749991 RepID=UPI00237EAB32|nr:alpha/beta fold hydrolase [Nocardia gipuzkoensis]MDE1672663.1 hypothetical protein [Nocardia gipuzkoensis]